MVVIVPVSLLDWGIGCSRYGDYSDISMKMQSEDSSSPPSCGDNYRPSPDREEISVNWQWFACERSQTCIHIDNRCDLHPHPDCLYEGIAEDEEDCIDEYKRKNLIQRSAYFKCPSAIHNSKTPPIIEVVYNSAIDGFAINYKSR